MPRPDDDTASAPLTRAGLPAEGRFLEAPKKRSADRILGG